MLWSRYAAASRWVQREQDSALARQLNGLPIRVPMARLDKEDLPPLSAAERSLDLRPEANWEAELAKLLADLPIRLGPDLETRVVEAAIPWTVKIQTVMTHVQRGEPVVVLASRKGCSHTFARQLQA